MNHFLCPFFLHFVLVFFDYALIYSKTWTSHLSHVNEVIHLLFKHRLFLKQFKCAFGASEVEYLGHIVDNDGVQVDSKKIEAMRDWPHPKTLKNLHSFLGLMGYYRKFVHNYGKIAAPLTSLLKNNYFTWTPVVDHSFQALKDFMCSNPVLELPYFTKTFVLECDASRKGIVVILMKDGMPLAFNKKKKIQRGIWANPFIKNKCFLFNMV
jgi:hypothetical protein